MKSAPSEAGHWSCAALLSVSGKYALMGIALGLLLASSHGYAFFGKKQETQQQLSAYAELMARGQYEQAVVAAEATMTRRARKKEKKGEVDGRALLSYAHMAYALFWSDQYEEAIRRFDQVEVSIKKFETRMIASGAIEAIGGTFLGNKIKRYPPKASDGVLVNTYKAMAFMELNQLDDARIEFNRADERTRRAVELYAKEIERMKDAEGKEDEPSVSEEKVSDLIDEHYADLSQWAVYEDFVNPYTVYMHALYFFAAGQVSSDFENAVTSMERIVGMYPDNPMATSDLALFNEVASGNKLRSDIDDSVWLICEDGIGPEIVSKELDIMVNSNQQQMPVRLVLPELQINPEGTGGCAVQQETGLLQAQEIASMDRVFATEFKKRLPFEITMSILNAVVQASMQNEAKKKGGMLGQMLVASYSRDVASTETRVWLGLPKTWYALRVARPADGTLEVLTPQGIPVASIKLPAAKFTLAHVRIPDAGAYHATHAIVLSAAP